ncbi:unnamed protein product, partial [Notodromas monacha]
KYVQDLMQENTESIFDKIVNKFGHFYVCGDCVMAVEVYATLGKILQDLGKMSAEDAEDFLLTMKEENRYHEDIFGLTSHAKNPCQGGVCEGSLMKSYVPISSAVSNSKSKADMLQEAIKFLDEYFASEKRFSPPCEKISKMYFPMLRHDSFLFRSPDGKDNENRKIQVQIDIKNHGFYDLTEAELEFGAKLAWRNAARCIGRIQWSKLKLFDYRHVKTPSQMFEALLNHVKYGMNDGNIRYEYSQGFFLNKPVFECKKFDYLRRSAITVFPPRIAARDDFRMWNNQIFSFAGYTKTDGTIIGDPVNVEFTQDGREKEDGSTSCLWFSRVQDTNQNISSSLRNWSRLFGFPTQTFICPIFPPELSRFEWFTSLGIEWYALPGVSNMLFDCGGIEFPAAPFNGWYMSTEIAIRDLCDPQRYNLLKTIGEKMGLDVTNPSNFWKDRVAVEVNVAVMHSFQESGVTIVDHYTAAESFMKHLENENRLRRGCPADWVWIVPPMSGSLTPVYHQEMVMYHLKPSYEYQIYEVTVVIFRSTSEKKTFSGSSLVCVPVETFASKWFNKKKKLQGSCMVCFIQQFLLLLDSIILSSTRSARFTSSLFATALKVRIPLTILFATETGKSAKLANVLTGLFSHEFRIRTMEMAAYDFEELKRETLVILVSSTFGNGDPPENGKAFAKKLRQATCSRDANNNREELWSNLRFAVFGVGSTAYPNFAAFGKFLDHSLGSLGAHRLHEIGLGDELKGQEKAFYSWMKEIYLAVIKEFHLKTSLGAEILHSLNGSNEAVLDPKKLRFQSTDREDDLISALSHLHEKKIVPCKLLEIKHLCNMTADENGTIFVRLATGQIQGAMNYKPGDHIAVYPKNQKFLVNGIIPFLDDCPSPETPFELMEMQKTKHSSFGANDESESWKRVSGLPRSSVKTFLTCYKDITTPPNQDFLAILAKFSSNAEEKARLEILSKDEIQYENWRNGKNPNLLEVLEEFTSVKPPASLVIKMLPNLQPRFYSISSSQNVHPGEVHLTVGIVQYKKEDNGLVRFGVCSNFLKNASVGKIIPAFIRSAPGFKLPIDRKTPIIMIGSGTGIAPFRSFWQQRQAEFASSTRATTSSDFGPMNLYFGCRSKRSALYQEEVADLMKSSSILAEYHLALSREPGEQKVLKEITAVLAVESEYTVSCIFQKYVQNLLKKNATKVFASICEGSGHIFVCGGFAMAEDVRKTLQKIFRHQGQMSKTEARGYFQQMKVIDQTFIPESQARQNIKQRFPLDFKDENRYHEDIFGIANRRL